MISTPDTISCPVRASITSTVPSIPSSVVTSDVTVMVTILFTPGIPLAGTGVAVICASAFSMFKEAVSDESSYFPFSS